MPKQSAFEAFCAFWQSASAVPVSPAHELLAVALDEAAGAVLVVAEVELPLLVVDCASNGVTNIIDSAHAIALVFHRFINPPFAKPNTLRCQALADALARMRPQCWARPSDWIAGDVPSAARDDSAMESANRVTPHDRKGKILIGAYALLTSVVGDPERDGAASRQTKSGPERAAVSLYCRPLNARLAVDVDHDRAARWRAHLHVVIDAAKYIVHFPIIGPRLSFDRCASLNVLAVHLRCAATDIGADRRACHSAAGGRNVPATSAADLVTENAANDGPRDCRRNIGTVAPLFDDLLPFDPAALLRRTDDCAHRGDRHLIEPLLRRGTIFVDRRRDRNRFFGNAITAAIMRDVHIVVPAVVNKVDRLPAGAVLRAMLAPVLRVPGRYMQINRRRSRTRNRLHDHWTRIDELRRRQISNFDTTIETGLPNAYRHTHIRRQRRSARCDNGRCTEQTFHWKLPVFATPLL